MRTLSFNLNLPLPNSNSNSQFKSLSSSPSNLYIRRISPQSAVLPVAAGFGAGPLQLAISKSRLKSLSSKMGYIHTISSQSAVLPVAMGFDAVLLPLANSKSRLRSLSSSSHLGHICRISSQLVVDCFDAIPLPKSTPTPKSLSSTNSGMTNHSQPVVVVPIADAQPKLLAIASIYLQPVVPVVLEIPAIDAFPRSYSHFRVHNKLMLQTQLFLKNNNHSLILTTGRNMCENHPNLYGHSFCFVGYGSFLLAGCCDNLILVCFYDIDRSCPREALWNLITNELKFLPEPDFPRSVYHHCRVIYTSIRSYGFGFDPVSKDYKVLRFVQFEYENGNYSFGSGFTELYSLKTDSWKRVTNTNPGNVRPFAQIHINGIYYWKATVGEDYCRRQIEVILSFDFASEKFSHIPELMPRHISTNELFVGYDLVDFDGLLAALFHSELGSGSEPFTFEIWVWSGTESSWARRVPAIDVPATNIATIVGLFENDKLFLRSTEKELLLFDCATRELENLGIHDDPRLLWFNTKK